MEEIKLSGVTKSYGSGDGKIVALDGVDFNISRGEFAVILSYRMECRHACEHCQTVCGENIHASHETYQEVNPHEAAAHSPGHCIGRQTP